MRQTQSRWRAPSSRNGGEAQTEPRDPVSGELTRLGLAARTPSPSFLAQHPILPVLYAVNELDEGLFSRGR